jgi:hypothetical protein
VPDADPLDAAWSLVAAQALISRAMPMIAKFLSFIF